MTAAASFERLAPDHQRRVLLALCEQALPTWTRYVEAHRPIRYVDGVVGMAHEVDPALPGDALRAARAGSDADDVAARYREPIVAMQDDDLVFPEPVAFAYYAIYNLFLALAVGRAIDPLLIVNQALAAHEDPDAWSALLALAIHTTA